MNKTAKHCLSVLIFLTMLTGALMLLDYLLVPISRADFFLHDMERMKKKGPGVDMVIIGNSHYLYGFEPLVFEEVLGFENAYNASVTGLEISSKYYITEAMIKDFHPKAVLFDVDWISLYDRGSEITQSKLLGLDRLKGIQKIRHIVSDFLPSERIYALLRAYRFRDRLFWDGAIAGNVKLKRWAESTNYEIDYYQTQKGYDKGLACTEQPFSKIRSEGKFDEFLIFDHSKRYLDMIVDLCRSENIPLFLVTSPVSTVQQMNIGNYQGAVDYYSQYAAEKGVHYFDMNMLKQRDEIFNDSVMSDAGHLCETGAAIASRICAEIIRDELNGIDTGSRFYRSMDELSSDIKRVVAVGADIEEDGKFLHIRNIRATAGSGMRIFLNAEISENGTAYDPIIQTVSNGESVDIPLGSLDSGTVYIRITGTDRESGSTASAVYTITIEDR
ncbi:MAG: hypothetical protein IJI14_02225 [Anaerolineaceae bacterium]|nr:hypothetical protein [Anaerolineaceae bacterium]